MTKTEFARLLKQYLAVEGHSVNGLAEELGVKRHTLWRWRKGERNIDKFTADAIRAFFKTKFGE